MTKPYKHIKLRQGTEEWSKWRDESGLGGSDVASALAIDSKELAELVYMAPIQLHMLKIGEPVTRFSGNESSEEGKLQEPQILERLRYYDIESNDQMSIYRNMRMNNKVNGIIQPGDVLANEKYPHLFYSLDAFMTAGVNSKKPVALIETKLTTSMEASRYENRTNPAHYIQLMTGLMITELPVGYLVTMIDGKWFNITKVTPDVEIFKWIAKTSAHFWQNVLRAKIIKREYEIDAYYNVNPAVFTPKQLEGVERLQALEPDLVGTDHEVQFIKDQIITTTEEVVREGTMVEDSFLRDYLRISNEIAAKENERNVAYSKLIGSLNGFNVIEYPEVKGGFYSYKANKNGRASLYISPKLREHLTKPI